MSATYTFLASQFCHLGWSARARVSLFYVPVKMKLIVVTNVVAPLRLYLLPGFGTM